MPPLLQDMREINRRLSLHLDGITASQLQSKVITPRQMTALLSELLSAGAGFRATGLPVPGEDRELDPELKKYRWQVERLRDLLPSIHQGLLAERARVEAQRSRVRSVAEWARASRQTL
jgi:hypothetical protein